MISTIIFSFSLVKVWYNRWPVKYEPEFFFDGLLVTDTITTIVYYFSTYLPSADMDFCLRIGSFLIPSLEEEAGCSRSQLPSYCSTWSIVIESLPPYRLLQLSKHMVIVWRPVNFRKFRAAMCGGAFSWGSRTSRMGWRCHLLR